jgi:hypothetical protein
VQRIPLSHLLPETLACFMRIRLDADARSHVPSISVGYQLPLILNSGSSSVAMVLESF